MVDFINFYIYFGKYEGNVENLYYPKNKGSKFQEKN
jgi:hypothetical protein